MKVDYSSETGDGYNNRNLYTEIISDLIKGFASHMTPEEIYKNATIIDNLANLLVEKQIERFS